MNCGPLGGVILISLVSLIAACRVEDQPVRTDGAMDVRSMQKQEATVSDTNVHGSDQYIGEENFVSYSALPIGPDQQCVVGAQVDEDGMNQRPVVRLTKDGRDVWVARPRLPPLSFQGRATHCQVSESTVFVLVQSDTQPEASLSQTFVEMVALDRGSGTVLQVHSIEPPEVQGAYTAWVEQGGGNFRLAGGRVLIAGEYALLTSRETQVNFTVEIVEGPDKDES